MGGPPHVNKGHVCKVNVIDHENILKMKTKLFQMKGTISKGLVIKQLAFSWCSVSFLGSREGIIAVAIILTWI